MQEVEVHVLKPLPAPAHRARRPELEKLSDEQLLNAARNPMNDDPLVINTRSGLLHDGNGRAVELLRRLDDPNSAINQATKVPVEFYTPDMSMFPDLE